MSYRPVLPSPLKWAGGKSWLAVSLSEIFNAYRAANGPARLVDAFAGGLSIPLGLTPDECLFVDVNPHLMNFWRWVQHGLVLEDDDGIEFRNDSGIYYENRTKFNMLCQTGDYWTKQGALLFYYLNRNGFNGLCRFNRHGYFNVPFGRYKTINFRTDFRDYQPVMKGWDLWVGDFGTIPLKPNDFIYADPPYDNGFTSFAQRDFSWEDQVRLANWLAAHPGPSVASNLATDRILELYTKLGFTIHKLEVPRRISCDGDRTPALEMLAKKGC